MKIDRIRDERRRRGLGGWLFFDHHRRDPLAYSILGLPTELEASRRWYYFIPAFGEPRKLVHRIESRTLDALPGSKFEYSSWADQQGKLGALLEGSTRIAMQYSPNCAIPYVSLVDAGTLELVRSLGAEVVSSADLVQEFEARWTENQFDSHLKAGRLVDGVRRQAFELIGERLRSSTAIDEYEVKQFVANRFRELGMTATHGPIVAVNANASDPHYEPDRGRSSRIKWNDLVLLDMWAKLAQPDAVYYDITWTGFCGDVAPEQIQNVFEAVRDARKAATTFVISNIASPQPIEGWQVDDAARNLIAKRGYGEFFIHRTGHSIGTEVHGTGANMDNLESHDERQLISDTCFSIEPGIYLPEFGIRSEVNMYVGGQSAQVTGEEQEKLVRI